MGFRRFAMAHLLAGLMLAVAALWIFRPLIASALPELGLSDAGIAVANVKLAGAALVPFGRTVMSQEAAAAQNYQVVVGVEPLG